MTTTTTTLSTLDNQRRVCTNCHAESPDRFCVFCGKPTAIPGTPEAKKSHGSGLFVWPDIYDTRTADSAVLYGVGVAGWNTFCTAALALYSLCVGHKVAGLDGFALLDAALMAIVAWRIYRRSFAWSVFGLLFYLFERITYLIAVPQDAKHTSAVPYIMTVSFALAFVASIRGTYFLRQERKAGRA
jgi:hypothetical protein